MAFWWWKADLCFICYVIQSHIITSIVMIVGTVEVFCYVCVCVSVHLSLCFAFSSLWVTRSFFISLFYVNRYFTMFFVGFVCYEVHLCSYCGIAALIV